jgi:hypothetical protein
MSVGGVLYYRRFCIFDRFKDLYGKCGSSTRKPIRFFGVSGPGSVGEPNPEQAKFSFVWQQPLFCSRVNVS